MSNGSDLTDKTRLSLPITLAITVMVSLISGAVSATTAAYSLRDRCLEEVKLEVTAATALMRAERTADLRFYLEKETFSDWKQKERIRQDQQFYTLLNAIERLRTK